VGQADSVLRPAEIAARIRYFRERKGLRAIRLAEACGVSPGSVSEWESGNTEPTHENLARVARACGVDLAEFWSAPIVVVTAPKDEG
jgi:transcriptional regulator with XRE-family HTH domain